MRLTPRGRRRPDRRGCASRGRDAGPEGVGRRAARGRPRQRGAAAASREAHGVCRVATWRSSPAPGAATRACMSPATRPRCRRASATALAALAACVTARRGSRKLSASAVRRAPFREESAMLLPLQGRRIAYDLARAGGRADRLHHPFAGLRRRQLGRAGAGAVAGRLPRAADRHARAWRQRSGSRRLHDGGAGRRCRAGAERAGDPARALYRAVDRRHDRPGFRAGAWRPADLGDVVRHLAGKPPGRPRRLGPAHQHRARAPIRWSRSPSRPSSAG